MSNASPTGPRRSQPPKPPPLDPWAAFLSYLVPGLGQVYQGRVAKGLLFCVSLYALFFYGMYLGRGMNVYLPDDTKLPRIFLVSKPDESKPHARTFLNQLFPEGLELK